MAIIVLVQRKNDKALCANRAFKNGLFSAQFGAKLTSLFAIIHNVMTQEQ
jgi:hypothetical protein